MDTQADKKAQFLNVILQNKKLIFKVCNGYCKNALDREDLVQEVIIKLWKSYEKFDNRCKLSTWMYRIALNTAISHYRSVRLRYENTKPLHDSLLDVAADVNYDTETDDRVKKLYDIINHMNEMNRALMILYLDNNSYKDIADILGISESNVATKISRIKQQLKQQFTT
jgi:RNA polymerase sigma factor (sigma-70 family)